MIKMIIYLIALAVFLTQCFIMLFVYFNQRKPYKRALINAYQSHTPVDEFFYFILIPCLNEEKVIQNTLNNVLKLPGQKQIIVIDDDSIDDTLIKVHQVDGPISIVERKLPNARTGKGDSLNYAMPTIQTFIRQHNLNPKNCIVGVIDADGVLSNNSILKLNDAFSNERNDAVQLRVKMKSPLKVLQTFQDIEFFTINHLTQLFRANLNAVALCGNGQFFRYSSITKKLGTTPWGNALLEDYELTLRMELKGLHIAYIADAYVDQEALRNVKKLVIQRARWSQGGFNCWKYMKQIIQSKKMSLSQKFDSYFFFFQPVLNLLADFSIIYLTIRFVFKHINNPEFLFVVLIALAIIGLFFGIIFTIIYMQELKLSDRAKLIINRGDIFNIKFHVHNILFSIGLISYIYIVLFFSLIIAIYHLISHQTTWNKTQRI